MNMKLIVCLDVYRQYSGAANIAGKPIISIEVGADIMSAYQVSFPALLSEVKRAYSGGTNQLVIHGAPYSWNFPNTTVSRRNLHNVTHQH